MALYDNAAKMSELLQEVGAVEMIQQINWLDRPQVDYRDQLPENKLVRGRVLYAKTPEGKLGFDVELIRQFKAWADSHDIPLFLDHRVSGIVRDGRRHVIGMEATAKGSKTRFQVRKATIFCSGDFTHDREMI